MFNAKKKFDYMGHCTDGGPGVRKQYVVNICRGWAYQWMYYVWNINNIHNVDKII